MPREVDMRKEVPTEEPGHVYIHDSSSITAIKDELLKIRKNLDKITKNDLMEPLTKPVGKSKEYAHDIEIQKTPLLIISNIIGSNDFLYTISEACTVCYGSKKSFETNEERFNYIYSRTKVGHDSILEHSSVLYAIEISNINENFDIMYKITEFISSCKYLNTFVLRDFNDRILILVSGSLRGYKYLFNCDLCDNNDIIVSMRDVFANTFGKQMMMLVGGVEVPFIEPFTLYKEFLMKRKKETYATYPYKVNINSLDFNDLNVIKENKFVRIINYTDYYHDTLLDFLHTKGFSEYIAPNNARKFFEFKEFIARSNIYTVVFTNMSRVATHQLVRHRNAITQESMRYVDYSNATVTTYNRFVDEKPNSEDLFEISSKSAIDIYKLLCHLGAKKEEARGILPQNINCGAIYITFTRYNLDVFIKLRADKHAQEEIREYAMSLKKCMEENNI